MDPTKPEPKLPDMIMCGDHPSVTKTELNKKDKEEGDKDKMSNSFAKISPTTSRIEKPFPTEIRSRASEHILRRRTQDALQARLDSDPMSANRVLIQAAMGSIRWPPYLVCVWVLVLLVSHALHCLVGILERALPSVRKLCIYFRTWTEESWRGRAELGGRAGPAALALATGALYALYCGLYAAYCAALWAVEPLCDADDKPAALDAPRVTDYEDDTNTNTSASLK